MERKGKVKQLIKVRGTREKRFGAKGRKKEEFRNLGPKGFC